MAALTPPGASKKRLTPYGILMLVLALILLLGFLLVFLGLFSGGPAGPHLTVPHIMPAAFPSMTA